MKAYYQEIKAEYDAYLKTYFSKGKLPMRKTEAGYWGPTPLQTLRKMFEKIGLSDYDSFLDLGSGDGRAVILASLFGVKATGMEFDKQLHQKALEIKEKLSHIPNVENAELLNVDFFKEDLREYDIIFFNPDRPFFRGVEDKIIPELKGRLVVLENFFRPVNMNKEKEFVVNNVRIGVYK